MPTITAQEMASQATLDENKKMMDRAIWEIGTMDPSQVQSVTDTFECSKCKQRKCSFFQKQTRSADEPMTTFVTCLNCRARWRFC
mmetsp:Transcript_50376/g.109519  ORF Transcript_50376/g.109519 Transcript_50376/m.109519 type:complete len:85 (+) Transcript_50376:802-1056(+)